jgi:hypothetical protein
VLHFEGTFGSELVAALLAAEPLPRVRSATALRHILQDNPTVKQQLLQTQIELPAGSSQDAAQLMPLCCRSLSHTLASSRAGAFMVLHLLTQHHLHCFPSHHLNGGLHQ